MVLIHSTLVFILKERFTAKNNNFLFKPRVLRLLPKYLVLHVPQLRSKLGYIIPKNLPHNTFRKALMYIIKPLRKLQHVPSSRRRRSVSEFKNNERVLHKNFFMYKEHFVNNSVPLVGHIPSIYAGDVRPARD